MYSILYCYLNSLFKNLRIHKKVVVFYILYEGNISALNARLHIILCKSQPLGIVTAEALHSHYLTTQRSP